VEAREGRILTNGERRMDWLKGQELEPIRSRNGYTEHCGKIIIFFDP
jgi:hypothetical protein